MQDRVKWISVIIPVYNNIAELRKTLDALLLQTMPLEHFEVIVADDGSSVDMKAVVWEYRQKLTIRYFWQEDRGFCPGTARNMGIKAAEGELCVFFDCGVIPTAGCLEEYNRRYRETGEKAVLLGYIYGNDAYSDISEMRSIIDSHNPDEAARIMEENGMRDGREKAYSEFGDEIANWPAPWTVLWSLHFAVPTQFMRRNNIYFDPYFNTWGGEDNDFGIQLENQGAVYVLCRLAKAIHYPPEVRSIDKLKKDINFAGNFAHNRDYIVAKYAENRAVRLWRKEGWIKVNRILFIEQRGESIS